MRRDDVKRRFKIIGDSPALNEAVDIALQAAPTEVTVLVLGENGVGKDVFSQIIHQFSPRKHKKFIAINAGAIPEGTIDSELFGHEKGAFTSAYDSRKGYFEEANGGVLFLDEIAELPNPTQARLLRVLENGEFLRVGSSKIQKTDVRLVAATNKNLLREIQRGRFREDLFYRLNTVTIKVPPLRERGSDIDLLFRYFTGEFAQKYGRNPVRLTPTAQQQLHTYHWPGNVRELRNFAEKLSVLAPSDQLTEEQLLQFLPSVQNRLPTLVENEPVQNGTANGNGAADTQLLYRFMFELRNEITELKFGLNRVLEFISRGQAPMSAQGYAPYPAALPPAPAYVPEVQLAEEEEEDLSIEAKEQELIKRALDRHNQNRKKAAEELGISERTLYRKIKSYGLDK